MHPVFARSLFTCVRVCVCIIHERVEMCFFNKNPIRYAKSFVCLHVGLWSTCILLEKHLAEHQQQKVIMRLGIEHLLVACVVAGGGRLSGSRADDAGRYIVVILICCDNAKESLVYKSTCG